MTTVVRCGTLFDGTGGDPVEDAVLVVDEAGRIQAVGQADGLATPPHATVVNLSSSFGMRGVVDAHSHASIVPDVGDQMGQMRQPAVKQALHATANLKRDLMAGTTTMRVMAEEHFLDMDLREAIECSSIVGPRLLCAGRGITATNGHERALASFDGVNEIRRGVRENFQNGADHVKIFATGGVSSAGSTLQASGYSREEIRAAVEEGVSTIEHGALVSDDELQLMIDHGA